MPVPNVKRYLDGGKFYYNTEDTEYVFITPNNKYWKLVVTEDGILETIDVTSENT